jgi:hypothetical protein
MAGVSLGSFPVTVETLIGKEDRILSGRSVVFLLASFLRNTPPSVAFL